MTTSTVGYLSDSWVFFVIFELAASVAFVAYFFAFAASVELALVAVSLTHEPATHEAAYRAT